MKAIGYHTYAGGLAVGVAEHFELAGLGEHDGYGNEIKALNFDGVPLWASYDQWPRQRGRGASAVPFIFSNPPCAPFSFASAGRFYAWDADPRLHLWKDIVRLIPEAQPDILSIESVVPAWTRGREFIDQLAATAATWGYSTTVLLHNARWLGSVQDRKRVFFNFHKIQAAWPEPNFDNYVTVRDILKGVKVSEASKKRYSEAVMLAPHRAALYHSLPNGGRLSKAFNLKHGPNAERHAHNNKVIGRPGFLTARLAWDAPGPVFMGSGCILHPEEPRSLYPEEINAYTGFPKDWKWPDYGIDKLGTYASQGVSPLGGRWLGAGAKESIERGRRINRPDYAIVDGLSREGWARGRMIISDDPAGYADVMTEDQLVGPPQEPKKPRKMREGGPKIAFDPTAPIGSRMPGSGEFIRGLIVKGVDATDILEQVHAQFPGSKATKADVSWNRAKLRKEGVSV